MKKSFASFCLVLAAMATAGPALCAITTISTIGTATFQTSLTIVEGCRVDSKFDASFRRGAPTVSCDMAASALVAAAAAQSGPAWVVTF